MNQAEKESRAHTGYILALGAGAAVVVAVLYAYLWFSWALHAPLSPLPLEFEVKRGETLRAVMERMPPQALFMRRFPISLYSRLNGVERKIRYGKYRLPANASALDLLKMLERGKALLTRVTIPPGSTVETIAGGLDQAQVVDRAAFLRFARDLAKAQWVREKVFGRPRGKGDLEGYLYPDTYYFSPNSTPFTVAFVMVKNLYNHLPPDWKERCKALGLSLHQVLTLASIVEKETYLRSEMPVIAEVFLRRLKIGMKLQADPTVIYAVQRATGIRPRRLRKRDLAIDSPYNTYIFKGLPPGPICSPSEAAIDAVLHPTNTHYLYFVANNKGGHKFSTTLREHINAVNRYQKRR